MRAISLWQPWASLVACGIKRTETRHWPAPQSCIGETLAIHAAKTNQGRDAFDDHQLPAPFRELPRGAIVCTVTLAWRQRVQHLSKASPVIAKFDNGNSMVTDHYGDYTPGRWIWGLTDLRPLRNPVPVRGRQSIWSLDPDTKAQVIAEGGASC